MTGQEYAAMRPFCKAFDWGAVYWRAVRRGLDRSAAAYCADEAQRRHASERGYRKRPVKAPR